MWGKISFEEGATVVGSTGRKGGHLATVTQGFSAVTGANSGVVGTVEDFDRRLFAGLVLRTLLLTKNENDGQRP